MKIVDTYTVEYSKTRIKYFIVETQFGLCKITEKDYNEGKVTTIKSALDKTQYYYNYANYIHKDSFIYLSDYQGPKVPIHMLCKENKHSFSLTPDAHLNKLTKCPLCAKNAKPGLQQLIQDFNKIHNNKYDYSKFEYKTSSTKSCIICPTHGPFWKSSENHKHKTRPQGCPSCSLNMLKNVSGWSKFNFIKCCNKNNRIGYLLYHTLL